ncbi:MAG: dTMP kinase [Peptococcaceae bacterium]|jgi:dTMP kinase|nr:dTMP kinase [Peptococcaceae bacterium]MDH7525417.1 dTMP kinase [Peptococcaceae bacterium]
MTAKGKFIVLEGVDGSGISTQAGCLREWMGKNEVSFGRTYFTKEPTDGPVGSLIRLALAKRLKPLDERVMALLFAADRMDHLCCGGENEQKEGIISLLKKGFNVVSDRYYLSSFAYQSLQVELEWLRQINSHCLKPDLTILLEVPVEEAAQRRYKSRIHEELYERTDYLTKIGANYAATARLLQSEGENIVVINGSRNQEQVFEDIKKAISALFS